MNKQEFLDLQECEQTAILLKEGILYMHFVQKGFSVSFYNFKKLFVKILSEDGNRKVDVSKSTTYNAMSEENTLDF